MEFSYRNDCATATDLEIFLNECDKYFTLTLNSRVGNISKYAMKIRINGVTFEAWLQGKLVGAIIGYFNDFESREAYIPVVCLIKNIQIKESHLILLNAQLHIVKRIVLSRLHWKLHP